MKRPIILMLVYAVAGIICSYLNIKSAIFYVGLFLSCVLLLCCYRKHNLMKYIVMLSLISSLFTNTYSSYLLNYKSSLNSLKENNINITGQIVSSPVNKGYKTSFYIKNSVYTYKGDTKKTKDKILINVYGGNKNYRVGDYYSFYGKVKEGKKYPDFDYNLYLKTIHVYNYINVSGKNVKFSNSSHLPFYIDKAFETRDKVSKVFYNNLNDKNASLIMGILFSDKSIDSKTKESFNNTGLSHILAVSGLHVGLVYGFLIFILGLCKMSKKTKLSIVSIILFIYVILAGFSVSAFRAFLLCMFIELLSTKKEKDPDSFNYLLIIGYMLLLINPLNLFSVSYLLSFSAVVGIMLITPIMNIKLIRFDDGYKRVFKYFLSLIIVSFSATLFTMPILINNFHQISLIGLIGNIIIIPLLPIIMIISVIGILLNKLYIGGIVFILLNYLLSFVRGIVMYLSSFPFAVLRIDKLNILFIMLYYFIIMLNFKYIRLKKNKEKSFLKIN